MASSRVCLPIAGMLEGPHALDERVASYDKAVARKSDDAELTDRFAAATTLRWTELPDTIASDDVPTLRRLGFSQAHPTPACWRSQADIIAELYIQQQRKV